jgi:succinate dehydrogenase/fumarate reductase flavoprotein subunit
VLLDLLEAWDANVSACATDRVGPYYRADFPTLDDTNWRVFVNSRYDAANERWELLTRPYINVVK